MPTTGSLWPAAYGGDINPLNIRKALFGTILMRDYNGSATSLTGVSPMANDGNLLTTLTVSGGGSWYDTGGVADTGPDFSPNITVAQTMIWQSRRTQRSDIDKDDDTIDVTFREQNNIVDCLNLNIPFTSMQDLGAAGYGISKPNFSDTLERQMIAIGVDGSQGRNVFFARVYPRIVISKLGKETWNPKNAIDTPLTWDVLTDPYTVGPDGVVAPPFIIYRDGPAWRAAGGAPAFGVSAPTAAATTSAHATLQFATPTGPDAPFTYTGEVSTDAGVTWVAGTLSGSPSVSGGNTTLTFSGLTAGATKLRAKATGTNLVVTTSQASNSVTVT